MGTIKLIIVFVVMMILLWRKKPLAPVVTGASIALAVLYGTDIVGFFKMAWTATKDQDTVELVAILTMIMILERVLRQHGYLERMLNALTGLFRDRRTVMAIIPGFIGLMPSAGGALFSAPLVEQAVGKAATAEQKAFINFYYRHIWDYVLPIYPGVLLASKITGIPLVTMILGLLPYGILIILMGLPYLYTMKMNEVETSTANDNTENGSDMNVVRQYSADPKVRNQLIKEVLLSTLPVVVLVGMVLASVNIILAIVIVVGVLLIKHGYTPRKFISLVREAVVVKTLVILWALMFFKEVMTATGSIDGLPLLLGKLPIPEFALAGLISFMVAYLTGQTGFYVGIAFPVIIAAAGGAVSLPLAVFVFVAGSAATMLSPMHLCLSLTIDYFKADLGKVLRKLIVFESILVVVALLMYLVLG